MRRGRRIWIFLLLLAALTAVCMGIRAVLHKRYQQDRGLRFVREMGAGINLGNSLDVKNVLEYHPEATVTDFETFWNNPPATWELFQTIYDKGFRTVRIPVSWYEHLQPDDTIDPEWMARVEQVVDWALDTGLYVIINTHHEPWVIPTEECEPQVTARLSRIWLQIARTFADRDHHLMFESMNEPRLVGSDVEWTSGTSELRRVVNRLNAVFVRTVRSTGGGNSSRWLLLPAYATQNKETALAELVLPEDPNLIVSVHAYLPYAFAQGAGETEWTIREPKDTEEISKMMERLDRLFLQNHIPVMITEFSCVNQDNLESRLDWTGYYTGLARTLGIPCVWWDNGDEYKLLNREDYTWEDPAIAYLLLQNAVTPAEKPWYISE